MAAVTSLAAGPRRPDDDRARRLLGRPRPGRPRSSLPSASPADDHPRDAPADRIDPVPPGFLAARWQGTPRRPAATSSLPWAAAAAAVRFQPGTMAASVGHPGRAPPGRQDDEVAAASR
jgi:hypothetical protein